MLRAMKPSTSWPVYVSFGLLAAAQVARAEIQPNPYQAIIERNPFGLKPPPPPVEAPAPTPTTLPGRVILTGITTILGPPRAFLEITDQEVGKAATTRKPILHEGDRDGTLEVISIDVEKSVVRVRHAGIETNLVFETPKLAASAPAAPSGFAPPAAPAPAIYSPPNSAAVGRGSAGTSFGNSSAATPASYGGGAASIFGGVPSAGGAGSAGAYGGGTVPAVYGSGLGSASTPVFGATTASAGGTGLQIPPRTLRTDTPAAGNPEAPQPPIDPAKQYLQMMLDHEVHTQAGRSYPPIPPPPPGW